MPKIDFIQILLNILGHVRLHSKHSFWKIEKFILRVSASKTKFWTYSSNWHFSVSNWSKMTKMVKIVVFDLKLAKNDQNGQNCRFQSKVDQKWQKRSKMVFSIQNFPKMTKTVKMGVLNLKLAKNDQNDQNWCFQSKIGQNWPKRSKKTRNCLQVQTGSDIKRPWTSTWIRLIQFWTWTFFRNQNIEFGDLKFWLWFLLTSVLKS